METSRIQYYDHTQHVATYYPLYVSLEKWLAKVLFKEELSRVFLSSNEYVYRRRFELTDTSQAYDQVSASSLQFPFGNYWPLNSGWRPDDRLAALQAAMIETGIFTGRGKIRAIPVYMPITFVAHFDREDDARIAYERLLWVSYRERYFTSETAWQGERLGLPMNIRIENLSFNPTFTEKDWLESNRIFVVEALIRLRSYIVTGASIGDDDFSNIDITNPLYFLTEEAILEFATSKGKAPDVVVQDFSGGFNPFIQINRLGMDKATQTTATIGWDVEADSLSNIHIKLSNGKEYLVDPDKTSIRIEGLTKGSVYDVLVTFTTNTGLAKSLSIKIETEKGKQKQASDGLVGTKW